MAIHRDTGRLLLWLGIMVVAEYALSAIHHIYGGLVYASPMRMSMPIYGGVALLVTLGLLVWYARTRSGNALTLFGIAVGITSIGTGLVDSVYGHAYKNILFLAGVPKEIALTIHPPIDPSDFAYPPNDLFFEGTGLIKLVILYFMTILLYHLIRNWQIEHQSSMQLPAIPFASSIWVTLGIAAIVVGGSLLFAHFGTSRVPLLVLSLLINGVGVFAIVAAIRGIIGSNAQHTISPSAKPKAEQL